jgi:hypothetical protein
VRVACIVAAEAIRSEAAGTANHANRIIWAKAVFQNPVAQAEPMLWAVLAQNRALTSAQIIGATDAGLLTAVNVEIDVLAQG